MAACLAMAGTCAAASVCVRFPGGAALLDEALQDIVPYGRYADIRPLKQVGIERYVLFDGKQCALCDAAGTMLTGFEYDDICARDGRILVTQAGSCGVIDVDGRTLCEAAYARIVADGGYIWALRRDVAGGDMLLTCLSDDGRAGRALPVMEIGDGGPGGLLPAQSPDTGLWGMASPDGLWAVEPRYECVSGFTAGRAVVSAGGLSGVIDGTGALVIPLSFDAVSIGRSGLILARSGEGLHVYAPDGTPMAAYPAEGAFLAPLGDGYALYARDAVQYFDQDGYAVGTYPPDAALYEGGGAGVIVSDGAWGEACVRLEGSDALYQDLRLLGYDGEGAIYAYAQMRTARYHSSALDEEQLAVDMRSLRYGIVGRDGQPRTQAIYKSLQAVADDLILAKKNETYMLVDAGGAVLRLFGEVMDETGEDVR